MNNIAKAMAKKIMIKWKIRTAHVWTNIRNCVACWKCIDACPKQVIGKVGFLWHKHIVLKNPENCIGCKKCIQICPKGVFSEKIKFAELLGRQI
jgi:ferredoxin